VRMSKTSGESQAVTTVGKNGSGDFRQNRVKLMRTFGY
jgi:hypothetical protein